MGWNLRGSTHVIWHLFGWFPVPDDAWVEQPHDYTEWRDDKLDGLLRCDRDRRRLWKHCNDSPVFLSISNVGVEHRPGNRYWWRSYPVG